MRLRRIEAVRYGRLEGASLGNLGDKLTVVLGPNEAGKSTYTALVRHILYGFPTPAAREPRFLATGGKRQGRLVFESHEGAWVVERTEGSHGGPTTIHTLRGPERPSLLDEVRHGVSADAYRVVFGFGLAEMAQIEELRGKDDDIVSRLYAAGAGLAVSPQDVRAAIDKAAEELWAPRGSTRVVNKIYAETRTIKSRLRELEAEAAGYAADQERLTALDAALAAARVERDAATLHHRELERDATALEEREREVDTLASTLLKSRRAAATLSDAVAKLDPDERILAVSAELDSLIADLSAQRERLQRTGTLEAAVESLDTRIAAKARELGLAPGEVPTPTPETAAMAEKWRETLSRAELQAAQSERAAREATARVVAAEEALAGAVEVPEPGGGTPVAAWVMLGVGLLSAAAGLLSQQHFATAAGALLVVIGSVFALSKPKRPGAASSSANALRLRDRAVDAQESATAAAEMARTDAEAHAAEVAAWRAWLRERGLEAGGEDPVGVATYLSEVRALSSLASDRDSRVAEASHERAAASGYADRLARAVATFMPDAAGTSPEESLVIAERARQLLAGTRDTAAARAHNEELLGIATLEMRKFEEAQRASTQAAEQIIRSRGIENGGLATLRALEDTARADAQTAAESVDALTEKAATLRGELRGEGRESEMGDLRLRLTSLEERKARKAVDYAVLAVASRLLVRAQERYERERQPEVVRTAEAVFARITDGRYTGLTVPLGGNEIRVFGENSSAHATTELSRGTAEQLYLALRIALIEQLGEVGSALPVLMDDILVNFDTERRDGAALAIAQLADARQVVFFTCHPEIAEVLSRVAPKRELLELNRCDL